jgi:hypothetical protein
MKLERALSADERRLRGNLGTRRIADRVNERRKELRIADHGFTPV